MWCFLRLQRTANEKNPVIFTLEMLPAEVAETQHGIAVLQSSSWAFLPCVPLWSTHMVPIWGDTNLLSLLPFLSPHAPNEGNARALPVMNRRCVLSTLSSSQFWWVSTFVTIWFDLSHNSLGVSLRRPSWRHQQKMLEPSARLQGKCSRSLSVGYPPVMLIVCLGKVNV